MNIEFTNNYSSMMRRFGMAGIAFFLIKGLLWLIVPFLFAWFI